MSAQTKVWHQKSNHKVYIVMFYYHRADSGILAFTDSDRLRYLHNQSTNDFNSLTPGEGCLTVFVTSTARTIDLALAYVTEDRVLVIVAPQRREKLLKWLDGFIFPFDKVKLQDATDDFSLITLVGEATDTVVTQLLGSYSNDGQEHSHQLGEIDSIPIRVAKGNDLALPGYNLIVPREQADTICQELAKQNLQQLSDREWEDLRITQGRPMPDHELTEDYNPLEAGLWQTISFDKGYYIGQETIARLNTYNGVKQQLWGVKLDKAVTPETPVTLDEKKIGVFTSYTETANGLFGLAYVKTKAGGAGLTVKIGDATGELVDVPFVSTGLEVKISDNKNDLI